MGHPTELLPNGDFESVSFWVLNSFAFYSTAAGAPWRNSTAMHLQAIDHSILGVLEGQLRGTTTGPTLLTGVEYLLRGRVVAQVNSGDATLRLRIAGAEVATWKASTLPVRGSGEDHLLFEHRFTPAGDDPEIRFDGDGDTGPDSVCHFYLDALSVVEFEEVLLLGLQRNIRDKMILDLQDVTTGNGFSMTLAEVLTAPKKVDLLVTPAVGIAPGTGGQSDRTSISGEMESRVFFQLQAVFSADAPADEVHDGLDDMRNAIERSGTSGSGPTGQSNICTLAGVLDAIVADWEEVPLDEEARTSWGIWTAEVEVRYVYTGGNL